ncbi:hypothetical protein F4779DRAFT_644143 [Xylariaceae sp. FL0662B]|nr:hypothetical protein F4779DRAFT_644143 [Xylariaceae sp. FL0662B]
MGVGENNKTRIYPANQPSAEPPLSSIAHTEANTVQVSLSTPQQTHKLNTIEVPSLQAEKMKLLKTLSLLALTQVPLGSGEWHLEVYGSNDCSGTATYSHNDTDDSGCLPINPAHQSFRVGDLGADCELYLFATMNDCFSDDPEQWYDQSNEEVCIAPRFQWDAYFVQCV